MKDAGCRARLRRQQSKGRGHQVRPRSIGGASSKAPASIVLTDRRGDPRQPSQALHSPLRSGERDVAQ